MKSVLWMIHITAFIGSVDIIISVIMYIEYSNNGGKCYSVCIADITLCGEYQLQYVLVPDSGSGVSKA